MQLLIRIGRILAKLRNIKHPTRTTGQKEVSAANHVTEEPRPPRPVLTGLYGWLYVIYVITDCDFLVVFIKKDGDFTDLFVHRGYTVCNLSEH